MDSSTSTLWINQFLIDGMSCSFLLLQCFIEIPVFDAHSVDPDQMPRFAASDLGLHYLSMSILGNARNKWVNPSFSSYAAHLFRVFTVQR